MRQPKREKSQEGAQVAAEAGASAVERRSEGVEHPEGTKSTATSRSNPQPRARFSYEHRILLDLLIEARLASGLSQKAVSRRLNKPHNHMQFVESNDRDLTFVEVARICEIVSLPVAELAARYSEQVREARKGQGVVASPLDDRD